MTGEMVSNNFSTIFIVILVASLHTICRSEERMKGREIPRIPDGNTSIL